MTDLASLRNLFATPTPPELGPGPRPGVTALGALQAAVDHALAERTTSPARHDALRALVLLWHDYHDASHKLVQDGATVDDSYVHGIVHRREPDFGNAKYWFHRVGRHAAFGELAKQVHSLLKARGESGLETRLLPRAQWDAFAFIDACEEAAGRSGDEAQRELLREIQRIEFTVLLEHLAQ